VDGSSNKGGWTNVPVGAGRRQAPRSEILIGLDDAATTWPYLPVAALFAMCWIVFGWPWLTGSVTIPWDAKAQFAPQVQFLASSIARGESPFWTPFAFSGHPQIADPQSLIFSPPFLILALVNAAPSLRAIDSTVLLMVLASGLGILWLVRDLGWHWAGAVIGAIGFCFGAAMAWRLQHFGQVLSMAYLPFALLFLKRGLERQSALCGLGAGVMTAFVVLGRDQVGLLCVYALVGYVAWYLATADRFGDALRGSIKPLAAGAASGLALVAIPLILTLLLAGQSNRPEIDYPGAAAGSLHPAQFVTAIIPHIYGAAGEMEKYWGPPSFTWLGTGLYTAQNVGQMYLGAIPILLLIVGLMRGVLWHRDVRYFTLAAVLVTLYALGGYTPVFRGFYELLPGVKLYRRPADAVFLMGGFASILAGYVTHRMFTWTLPEPKRWQRVAEIVVVATAFVFSIAAATILDRMGRALEPMLIAAGWIAAGALAIYAADIQKTVRPIAAASLLIALTIVDVAWNNGPNGASAMDPKELEILEPGSKNQTLAFVRHKLSEPPAPNHRDRIELVGLGFHWPNASLTHGLEQTLGYNPVRLKLYSAATGAGDSSGAAGQRKFSKLMPSYKSPMADLLGLRYVVSGVPVEQIDKVLLPGDLKLLARTHDAFIYENPRALPRVMFASRSQRADFASLLANGPMPSIDYTSTVLLEAETSGIERRPGQATLVKYTNTLIEIECDSPDGGWVVLNDVWHPWWFAAVDDQPAPLLKANVLFRGLAVPSGRHRVTLTFAPISGAIQEIRGGARPVH
jgi:hypothetical protein